MSFSGNAAVLNFMDRMDVFSLFGNAIDNAMEATERLDNPEKKLIDIAIEERGDLVFLNISNYYDGTLHLTTDLPETSKKYEEGYHGFGLKSMRMIAEKYNGGLQITTHDELFLLNIFLQKTK